MKERIKELAQGFGFDPVGITHLQSLEEGDRAIQNWVAQGKHGSMKYLEDFSQRRERLLKEIPNAKSVLVLGVNYFTPEASTKKELQGRIARYAWGKDYHQIIGQKHQALIQEIRKQAPENFLARSCVDTQPLPERFAAQQAGLGFIGKSTVLLSKTYGPWLFLSEIVTNLDLEEDMPTGGDCGTCVKCQEICPTGALDEDYKIDARLCIAYWTIEHKGVIPEKIRFKIKDWIFGCDECLAICPFTTHEKSTEWQELHPAAGPGPWMSFEKLFNLDSNKAYQRAFEGTALLRAGRKQMLRNACVVLGNSGKPEAIPYLAKALCDQAPLVRQHAAWGLGQISGDAAKTLLRSQLETESEAEVSQEIKNALAVDN